MNMFVDACRAVFVTMRHWLRWIQTTLQVLTVMMCCVQIPSDIDWSTETVVKPPHNFPTLIYMAIKSSKIGKVTLSEIYGYIQDHFQFYRDNDSGWKVRVYFGHHSPGCPFCGVPCTNKTRSVHLPAELDSSQSHAKQVFRTKRS